MSGLSSLERVFTKLLRPNVYKYGKALGKEASNGIRVFENFDKNGTKVLTSLKNGELYKTTEIKSQSFINEWCKNSTDRHDIIVKNHETGSAFNLYRGTTKNYDGTIDKFNGTYLINSDAGVLESTNISNIYRGNNLVKNYTSTVSKGGTFYKSVEKSYTAENELSHVRTELRASNYKMPNGQIVNYDRTQHLLPKVESYGRNKAIRYMEKTAREIELTPNGVNQFDPSCIPEYANNLLEKHVFLKG